MKPDRSTRRAFCLACEAHRLRIRVAGGASSVRASFQASRYLRKYSAFNLMYAFHCAGTIPWS